MSPDLNAHSLRGKEITGMAYVNIKEASDDRLHFVREPTARAWAILVGQYDYLNIRSTTCFFNVDFAFFLFSQM